MVSSESCAVTVAEEVEVVVQEEADVDESKEDSEEASK